MPGGDLAFQLGLRGAEDNHAGRDGMAVRLARRGCSIFKASLLPLLPLLARLLEVIGWAGAPGSPAPSLGFRGTQGGSQLLRRGEAGWRGRGGYRVPGRSGMGATRADQRGIP